MQKVIILIGDNVKRTRTIGAHFILVLTYLYNISAQMVHKFWRRTDAGGLEQDTEKDKVPAIFC